MSHDLLDHARPVWCALCNGPHDPCRNVEELVPEPYCTYCGTFGHLADDCDERELCDWSDEAVERMGFEVFRWKGGPVRFPQLHDRDWLARCLDAGLTYPQIAARIGCSRPALANAISAFHLTRRPRRDLHHDVLSDRAWLEARCDGTRTIPEIAVEAGSSPLTVRHWLARHDLHDTFVRNRRTVDVARRDARRAEKAAEKAARAVPRFPQLRDLDWLHAAVEERGCAAVSREIGCHVSSVMTALTRHGLSYTRLCDHPKPPKVARKRGRPRVEFDVAQAAEFYRAGCTLAEVGDLYGVTGATIHSRFQEAGIECRPTGRPRRS